MDGRKVLSNIIAMLFDTLELKSWNVYENINGANVTLRFRDKIPVAGNTEAEEPRITSYKRKSKTQISRDRTRMGRYNTRS